MKRALFPILTPILLSLALACAGEEGEVTAVTESAHTPPPDTSTALSTVPPAAPAAALDPCTLLDSAQIEGVLGQEMSTGMLTSTELLARCSWTPTSGPEGGVSVGLITGNVEEVLNDYRKTTGNIEVPGVGDGAFYNPELQHLVVRKGGRVAIIDFDQREEEVSEPAQELARLILPKL